MGFKKYKEYFLKYLRKCDDFLLYIERVILIITFLMICVSLSFQMVGRIFRSGIYFGWMKEFSQYCLVIFCLVGSIIAASKDDHIAVGFFVNSIFSRWKKYILLFSRSLFCFYGLYFGVLSMRYISFMLNTKQMTVNLPVNFPLGYIYIVFPFTFFAMTIQIAKYLLDSNIVLKYNKESS